ncbi:uncharacterized protein LOC131167209 [Malania oleifera]|uniref:uncharacterized protein LOC131167209 n=1 Tax=Malania oleifera TaxID=397392 RepID=UPI0025AE2E83|nr:uncharacterized protein LOC131167209 [Malania oleifera]
MLHGYSLHHSASLGFIAMKTAMGPPPTGNQNLPAAAAASRSTADPQLESSEETSTSTPSMKSPMDPPPPKAPNPPNPDPVQPQTESQPNSNHTNLPESPTELKTSPSEATGTGEALQDHAQSVSVPYTIPPWSEPPCHKFYLEVLKDGSIIDQLNIYEKGVYMFGRVDSCDFFLEHPSISRFHAVVQFKRNGEAYIYDLGSTHGTLVNKSQVKKKVYEELHVGDVIRFGHSSRLYIFQGPPDLMPPEADLERIRHAKGLQEMKDREASLLRAKLEGTLADGISWGMGEDAIEEAEDDVDEVTWQTYKGQLTEKQGKTRDKVIKRYEKIGNMKKEIDAIRSKDIAQGGLTQGQQTQIARNEQRISQIMEELENLEETLNESIEESIGARAGKISRGKKKVAAEDDDEYFSDDDEFYDRTKKKHSIQRAGESQSVETADTLLDKKDALIKEIVDKKGLLFTEKNRMESKTEVEAEAGDELDAYMSGLSSQLVLDKTVQLQKELSSLQSELDRIAYLLKIADPTGDAAKKRYSKKLEQKLKKSETVASRDLKVKNLRYENSEIPSPPMEQKKIPASEESVNGFSQKQETSDATPESEEKPEAEKFVNDATECKSTVYTVVKPQWLGAIEDTQIGESHQQEAPLQLQESDQFVDYKDRKNILGDVNKALVKADSEIENAAPGLIIRKRKQLEEAEDTDNEGPKQATSSSLGAQAMAEDAVALLLKHKRGYCASDDGGHDNIYMARGNSKSGNDDKKHKRVLGPERPSFLGGNSDYESWMPPEGQTGDGKTSLNERFGY